MQLIVQKKGYRWLTLLALVVATALLVLVARDSLAVHNSRQLELDGNTAYDLAGTPDGLGSDPGETNCPYTAMTSTNAEDCIKTTDPAAYDWADDVGNVLAGDQGVCKAGTNNLITENLVTPKGDLRKCVRDFEVSSTADVSYHTGSDKDFQEIWNGGPDDWGCVKLNNATNKADLLNAYVVQVKPTTGADANHQLVFFGAERDFEHGSVFNGFWFLQKPISSDCPPSTNGDFCPDPDDPDADTVNTTCTNPSLHTCGDVLILFNYDSGGRIGNIGAYQWDDSSQATLGGVLQTLGCDGLLGGATACPAGSPGTPPDCDADGDNDEKDNCTSLADSETHKTPTGVVCIKVNAGTADCRSVPTFFDDLCGRVNGTTGCTAAATRNDPNPSPCSGPGDVTTPWAPGCATPGTNCEGPLPSPTFSEAGADLTDLGLEIGCVAAFVAETRSSFSIDATLKDYAIGSFPACALSWEKRDESAGTAGNRPLQGGATFTITPNPLDGGSLVVTDCIVDGVVVLNCNAFNDKDPDAGQFSLPDVAPGTYMVCETTAPNGYARDDSLCRSVTVSASSPAASIGTVDVDDCLNATADEQDFCNRLGMILIDKDDDLGNPLVGATFRISPNPYWCHNDTLNGAGTPAANPDGFLDVLDDDANDADADDGEFKINRVCLFGAATVGTAETGAACQNNTNDDPLDDTVVNDGCGYTVTEQIAPPGFAKADPASQGPTALEESTMNLTISFNFDNRLGSLEWEKRSDIDGHLQDGATFTVDGADANSGDTTAGNDGVFRCHDTDTTNEQIPGAEAGVEDEDDPLTVKDDTDGMGADAVIDKDPDAGQLRLERVCLGTYTITETAAKNGFAIDPDATRVCTVSATTLSCVVGSALQTPPTGTDPPTGNDGCPDADDAGGDDVPPGSDFCNVVGSLFWEKLCKDASTPTEGNELCGGFQFSVDVAGTTGVDFTNIADCMTGTTCTAGAGLDQDPQAGQFCLDNMPIGPELTISETSQVTGYIQTAPVDGSGNPTSVKKTLTLSSTCDGIPTDAGVDFINTPLSKFRIDFICVAFSPSGSGECATKAEITCPTALPSSDSTPSGGFDDVSETFGNGTSTLLPNISSGYQCTIKIDP